MTPNMTDSNEQIDADILQCKADILRTRNEIVPLAGKEKTPARDVPAISEDQAKRPYGDISSIPTETINPEGQPVESESAQQQRSEIPRFDLAEQIMAEQRKITAVRRKAPGKKNEPQGQEQKADSIAQPEPALSEQERIITEIVARDIERLCGGE